MALSLLLDELSQHPDVLSVREKSVSEHPPGPRQGLRDLLSKTYDKDDIIPFKTWRHHGVSAIFHFAYRTNSCKYGDSSTYRHRDFASRVETFPLHDAHLSLGKGKLELLVVQCTDEVYEAQGMATWYRTYVRKPSPYFVRLAIWTLDYTYDAKSWNSWRTWCNQVIRSFPSALATIAVCFGGIKLYSNRSNDGKYQPVLHKYWGSAKIWSNLLENSQECCQFTRQRSSYRTLKPRNLCLLTSDGWTSIEVAHWESEPDNLAQTLTYLFVAYSSEQFDIEVNDDMEYLHEIGMTAAREARVTAFWVAGSCMRDEEELENDVYRISDILRGAQKMIIAVGPSKSESGSGFVNTTDHDQLLQWGSRMWTFPEVLLSPEDRISVYYRMGDSTKPDFIPKNQVASKLWPQDAEVSRQLIDHYMRTINLSRIELAVLALKCVYARRTTTFLEGDHAYALMGLLRTRPQIDRTDTQFQAFARLSLANDSDKLLERYICTLPRQQDQSWYDMTDAYGSSLWDIDPACQVAAICDNDTVILDGARGATIEWSKFEYIWKVTGRSLKRSISSCLLRFSWIFLIPGISYLFGGILLLILGYPSALGTLLISAIFLFPWFIIAMFYPLLVRITLGGKIRDIQAAFYGVEGYLNPVTVERLIFGGNFGRFKWSTNCSLLSQSRVNKHKETIGIDPCVDVDTRTKVEAAKVARPGEMRIFTLVDTYNLEVTIFEALHPPSVLLFCGSEGGKQRAVGCSYDWTTQTFYRETVLRVPTESLERVTRIPRFRMGIQRPNLETVAVPSRKETVSLWRNMKNLMLQSSR